MHKCVVCVLHADRMFTLPDSWCWPISCVPFLVSDPASSFCVFCCSMSLVTAAGAVPVKKKKKYAKSATLPKTFIVSQYTTQSRSPQHHAQSTMCSMLHVHSLVWIPGCWSPGTCCCSCVPEDVPLFFMALALSAFSLANWVFFLTWRLNPLFRKHRSFLFLSLTMSKGECGILHLCNFSEFFTQTCMFLCRFLNQKSECCHRNASMLLLSLQGQLASSQCTFWTQILEGFFYFWTGFATKESFPGKWKSCSTLTFWADLLLLLHRKHGRPSSNHFWGWPVEKHCRKITHKHVHQAWPWKAHVCCRDAFFLLSMSTGHAN